MLLPAVSLAIALINGSGATDLTQQEKTAWRKIAPSVVYVLQDGQPAGAAALIDAQGFFLASKSIIHRMAVDGRTWDGRLIRLNVKSSDEATQLVLLEAAEWTEKGVPEIQVGGLDPKSNGLPLLGVIGTGPIRADMSWTGNFGVVAPSQRVMPLTELRFEAPAELIGGALIFNLEGKLVGALNAALQNRDQQSSLQNSEITMKMQRSGVIPRTVRGDGVPVGPAQLVTAYSLGPAMIKRVIEGFRSPSHEVVHPTIGIYCVNAIEGGAQINGFKEGSTGLKAGLRRGDAIINIDGVNIRDQLDFSRVMLEKSADQKVKITIRRGNAMMVIDVVVGR